MKINLAVFFGCRSVEHEVSIISAVQAMRAIDRDKYDVIPVYVTKEGELFSGEPGKFGPVDRLHAFIIRLPVSGCFRRKI